MASFFDEQKSSNSFFAPTAPSGVGNEGYSLPGFLGNIAGGVKDIATGLTAMVKGTVGDIVHTGQEVFTGGDFEGPASYWGSVARSLPKLPGIYANRYGGATDIAKGFYEDPVSYLTDVLILAGGAGAVARVGRVGTLGEGVLPKLIPDVAARAILGGGEAEGWRSLAKFASAEGKPTVPIEATLSKNPGTALIQRGILRATSMTPEAAKGYFAPLNEADQFAYVNAQSAIRYANANSLRILKTKPAQYVATRSGAALLGALRVNTRDLSREARDAFTEATMVKGENGKLTQIANPEEVAMIDRGTAIPEGAPYQVTDPVGKNAVLPESSLSIPESSPMEDGQIFEQLVNGMGGPDGTNVVPSNLITPHSVGSQPGVPLHEYTIFADSPDDFQRVGQEGLATLGARDSGLRNYMNSDDIPTDSYHQFGTIDTPDGPVNVDLNITTHDLYSAQHNASGIQRRIDQKMAELTALEATAEKALAKSGGERLFEVGGHVKSNDLFRVTNQIADVNDEIFALQELSRAQFNLPRMQYWADHGVMPLDDKVLVAERLRHVAQRTITQTWMDNLGGTASEHWQRAYLEARVTKFDQKMARLAASFKEIHYGNGGDIDANAMVELGLALVNEGIPQKLIDQILSKIPTKNFARSLTNRTADKLWDYMVIEGGRGLEYSFPEFDWRVMHNDRLMAGAPVPTYFPHYSKKPSEWAARGSSKTVRVPHLTDDNKAMLFRTGREIKDPIEAYSRAAFEVINHQETMAMMDSLIKAFGRRLSKNEILDYRANQYAGEVLVAPEVVKNEFSLRSKMQYDRIMGVGKGMKVDDATAESIQRISEKALEEGLNNLADGKVYSVSRHVMKKFELEARLRFGNEALKIYYDGPMNLWKASVLSLSPRWVINNTIGNGIFMGIENPGALRYSLGQTDKKTAHITRSLLGQLDVTGERGFFPENMRFNSVIPDDAGGILGQAKRIKESWPGEKLSMWGNWVRNRNTHIEQASRRGVIVNELQKNLMDKWVQGAHSTMDVLNEAMRRGITPKISERVIVGLNKTLGDYTRYGPVEQAILRRFMVPFWGFYRHTGKVILRMPFEHPLKATVLQQLDDLDEQMYKDWPEYWRDRLVLGDFGGEDLMANLKSMNPLSVAYDDMPLISTLNPIARTIIERQTGVDSVTGSGFRAPDDIVEMPFGGSYQILRDGAGNVTGVEPLEGNVLPDLLKHFGGQFPQLSLLPQFERYPKSILLQLASLMGPSLSTSDIEGTVQRLQEEQAGALTQAQNQVAEATGTGGNSFFG